MDDPLPVRGFERLRDLPGDRQRLSEWHWRTRDPPRQIIAVDQFHHDRPSARSGVLQAVDLRDARVVERRECLRLALKPRDTIGIGRKRRRQDLQRDVARERRIAR